MYEDIACVLYKGGKPFFKDVKAQNIRPGWNKYMAEYYPEACAATKSWGKGR